MTVKAIISSAASASAGTPLSSDATGGTYLAIASGTTLETQGNNSDVIYATGASNTILVGGTIETTGKDSRGIYFDDATGSVQKVHVTDTGLITANLFSGSGADRDLGRPTA